VNGVARQSEDAVDRAARILETLDAWRLRAARLGSDRPARVVDLLGGNPFVTAKRVSEQLGVARTTAARAIERLVDLGILTQSGDRQRDRAYCAQALLDVLEAPAKLLP